MVQRKATFRTLIYLCVISAVVLFLLLFAVLHSSHVDTDPSTAGDVGGRLSEEAERRRRSLLVDTPGCKIPNIDPFDVSIRRLVTADNISVVCNGTPPMTYVDNTSATVFVTQLLNIFERKSVLARLVYPR